MHSRAVHKNTSNITRLLILSVAYITPHCLQIFYGVSTTHVAGLGTMLPNQWCQHRACRACRSDGVGLRASNEGYPKVPEDFTITEKAPTRALSWLNAPTSAFTFKTLC